MTASPVFHRYVALGDSFTEGVGDPDPSRPNGLRGWADRVAEVLATRTDDFGYANLAIRGRKLDAILDEQIEPAVAMRPDLVTIYAGANDILRPKVDLDDLVARYGEAVGRLTATGARVVVWTAVDPVGAPVIGTMRGRFAIYNELVREMADVHGATLLDYWRLREYADNRLWDEDRMHMSWRGHTRMAIAVLDVLGVPHDLVSEPMSKAAFVPKNERRDANLAWAKEHALPWVERRIRGTSSGDAVTAKRPSLGPI
ncbi:MAG: SGNH/GDSL hydrolase family protein [Nocardioidaceae bacterium]|nr:SGNH/GDSL hydrolase family protein [Nocardioidaceae bacterium]